MTIKCEVCSKPTPMPPLRPRGHEYPEAPALCSEACQDEEERRADLEAKENRAWMNAGDDSWAWGRP